MTENRLLTLILGGVLAALPLSSLGGDADKTTAHPLRLEPEKIPYSEMNTDIPPWPEEDILSGVSEHRYKYLYSGDIDVAIYEAKPMTLRIKDYSIDEFVTVVSGTLILTEEGGSPQRFGAGESVLVPKGFTGTWEMQGNFREMVVIMNENRRSQQ
ncbi:MAG: cupin domain-containing protein [Gammaproteobacteria bacterium]|nr:cupin domain-containing protein [Gammaproteobacteria bacterium]MDE0364543.1 cupin domain-containing protein [Gammaproteobacteria bacterium]